MIVTRERAFDSRPLWCSAIAVGATLGLGLVAVALGSFRLAGALQLMLNLVGLAVAVAVALGHRGRSRRAWWLFAAALGCWAWTGAALALMDATGSDLSGTGWSLRMLYLVGMVLAWLGLRRLPRRPWVSGERVWVRLDAAALFSCLVLLLHLVVLRDTLAEVPFATAAPAAGYGIVDMALIVTAVDVARRSEVARRPVAILMVAAMVLWAAGDCVLFAQLVSGKAVVAGAVGETLYAGGFAALVCAGVAELRRTAVRSNQVSRIWTRQARWAQVYGPDVFILTVSWVVLLLGPRSVLDWTLTLVGGGFSAVRQVAQAVRLDRSRAELEQRVAERTAELRTVSARQGRILDAVGEAVLGVDRLGRITFANQRCVEMLGWERHELLGRDVCGIICSHHKNACGVAHVLATGVAIRDVENTCPRRDGTLLPVEFTLSPKTDDEDALQGVVIAIRDASARHVVEQHKHQFVSSVSHELRTPLTSIRGVLEVLADGDAGELTPTAQTLVETAERGVRRLGRLVDDIIDVEKLAAGTFSVDPVESDLEAVLRDAVASLRPVAAQADVRISLRTNDVDPVLCDRDRVVQALVNLVGNAVKFSSAGDLVEVTTRQLRDEEVVVEVRDRGRGIPAADLPHVFERFRQVSVADAKEKGGTGLGLTITRSIVERHQGRIWVESELGVGSTFCFTLPTAHQRAAAADPLPPVRPLSHPSPVLVEAVSDQRVGAGRSKMPA